MSNLKPDVLQMLVIGKGCGLTFVKEALGQYLSHYDCFFLIDKYAEQMAQFVRELEELGLLIRISPGELEPVEMLIDEALKTCFPNYNYQEPEWPEPPANASEETIDWP